MAGRQVETLTSQDAIKTYRYLRFGMIGAVVALAASIGVERSKVGCWQTSISAYFYTPTQAIFVGAMFAVGLSLIVYKGRRLGEDVCLNFAGMLAPVVAVAPTTDVGDCWSIEPVPLPVQPDGELAGWVVADIENNMYALLIAGGIGVAVATIVSLALRRNTSIAAGERGTRVPLLIAAIVLVGAWWLLGNWSEFNTKAHGYAAVLMFVFLVGAIVFTVVEKWRERPTVWLWIYAGVAFMMILGGALIPTTRVFGDHTVFALEAYEIFFFAVYWIAQTVENWDEKVVGAALEAAAT